MTGITTGAESKFYVSATAPATLDQAGYEAINDWELTPCMTEIPEIARTFSKVSFDCLFGGSTETARGSQEPIELAIPFQDKPANAGQVIVATAASPTSTGLPSEIISCKVENKTGTQQVYLQAKVFKYGPGQRVMNEITMRIVEIVADASTLVEVNS